MWNILNNYGCTPNKSLTLKFPDESIFADKSLIRHFIRGYFDGDGCITRHIGKNTVSLVTNILGTYNFLNSLEQQCNFPANSIIKRKDKRHSDPIYSLNFSKSQSLQFIHFIYDDANIYLDRKYKLYQFFKDTGSRSKKEFLELLSNKIDETPNMDNIEI